MEDEEMSNTDGNGNDEVMTGQVAQAEESEEERRERERAEKKAKQFLTWEGANMEAESGFPLTEGHYSTDNRDDPTRVWVERKIYLQKTVSDSGYELGSKSGDEWKEEEAYNAFRLFKRNPLGILEYTPWIAVPDNSGGYGEREAMAAYMMVLKTGKLPEVDRRGRLKSAK